MIPTSTPRFAFAALASLALMGTPSRLEAQDAAALAAPVEAPISENSPELTHARRGRPETGIGDAFSGWLDVGIFSGRYRTGSFFVSGTQLGVRIGIEHEARLTLDWGFAYAIAHVAGTITTPTTSFDYDATVERMEAQNPVMAFDWLPWLGTGARLSVGLAIAIPSAAIQTFGDANQAGPGTPAEAATGDASRTTHDVWMAMNGAWSPWRYQPERAAVALPLAVLIDVGPIELAFEGALAVSVPVLGGAGVADAIAQIAADLYGTPVHFGPHQALTLGARASLVGYHLGASTAAVQSSLEPWVRLDLRPAFLSMRGIVNLGDPFGVGTETGVWSVHVGGGIAAD